VTNSVGTGIAMTRFMPENNSYDAHARACSDDDLWGQVKRTVNGKPLPDAQIAMIINRVSTQLALDKSDTLLDLCCGNAALSTQWFRQCTQGVGVDASPHLIEIANTRFAGDGRDRYIVSEALSYLLSTPENAGFTKAVCYGSLQYFSRERAGALLSALRENLPTLQRVMIGNIPDRDRAALFFNSDRADNVDLDSPLSPIGVWYSARAFSELAEASGWHCEISMMPAEFHASHYRFDALLSPMKRASQ